MNNPLTAGHVKLGYLLPYLPASIVGAFEKGTRGLPQFLRERISTQMVAILRKPGAAESSQEEVR